MTISPIKIINHWEEKELYPKGKSIFACKKCTSYEIEDDVYTVLASKMKNYSEKYSSYLNFYFASRHAGRPQYNFIFIDFECSNCNEKHKAFFYVKFEENYFPKNEREFLLADISNQQLEENVDGIYNRDVCQIFMRKFFIRWYILKNITYVAVPFIGNTFQTAKKRIDLLNDFLSNLHPAKTLLITRTATLNLIKKDIDEDLGKVGSYDILDKHNLLHPIIKSAFRKTSFHAKFYCGISDKGVEVLVGSHNLHGGPSMENLMLKKYELSKFIDRYMFQINVVPTILPNSDSIEVLIFNRDKPLITDSFTNNASDLVDKYF